MTDDPTNCRDCPGDNDATHYSYYECDECYEPIGAVNAVPVNELEELIEEWDGQILNRDAHPEEPDRVLADCVDELREVIEDHD